MSDSSVIPKLVRPIWTPADTAALRVVADQFPAEVGNSVVLDTIADSEGLAR